MNNTRQGTFTPAQWLWQSRRMNELSSVVRSMPKERGEMLERAQIALNEAQRLCDSPPFNAQPNVPVLALQLFAQAAHFALSAEAQARCSVDESFTKPSDLREAEQRAGLTLSSFVPARELVDPVLALLHQLDQDPHPDLLVRNEEVEHQLRLVAEALVQHSNRACRGMEQIWFDRLFRVGLPLLVVLLVVVGVRVAQTRARLWEETNMPWRTSSTHREPGCQSPRQGCEQDHFFFHTRNEDRPWIVFDLTDKGSVSRVTIENRTDCPDCSSRAVPLLIEVSDDQKSWKEVARRDKDFTTFTASFPRTKTRWLRLRVTRRSFFHLKQVRVER